MNAGIMCRAPHILMEIDFMTLGTECVCVEVDQESVQPWKGWAHAYDGGNFSQRFPLD